MAKFFFFEKIVQLFYTHVFTEPKNSYGKGTQLGVTFASGYLAGVVCAIVSHPADSVVSLLGKAENKGKSVGTIAGEVGFMSLATKGLGTRVIMIGSSLCYPPPTPCIVDAILYSGTLTGESRWFFWLFSHFVLNDCRQASNGGYTIHSRAPWAWAQPAASKRHMQNPKFVSHK